MNHQDSDEKFHREDDVEHRRYAPKWVREQPTAEPEQPYINSAPISPATGRAHREWPPISDFNSSPQRVPEPPVRLEDESSGLIARVAMFVSFAALIALLIIFAKPLSQFAIGLFDSHSERADAKTDRAPVRTPAPEQRAPASSSLCSDGTDRGCICGEHTRYRPASAIRRHSAAAARRAATGGTIESCATARTGITAFE